MSIAGATPLGSFVNALARRRTPNDLGADAWWDFSEAATVGKVGGMWQDTAGTIPAVNTLEAKRVDDKSGNGYHAIVGGGGTTGPDWVSPAITGKGAAAFASGPTNWLQYAGSVAVDSPALSFFFIIQVDTTNNTGVAFSARGSAGPGSHVDFWAFNAVAANRFYRMQVNAGADLNTTTRLWTGILGKYLWFYFEFDQSTSASYIDNVFEANGSAWPDAFGAEGPLQLGGKLGGATYTGRILEIGIFGKKLSALERTNLWNYHNNRYGLDGQ